MSKLRWTLQYNNGFYRGSDAYRTLVELWKNYVIGPLPIGPKVKVMREMAAAVKPVVGRGTTVKMWREPHGNRASQSRYVQELIARGITVGPLRRRRQAAPRPTPTPPVEMQAVAVPVAQQAVRVPLPQQGWESMILGNLVVTPEENAWQHIAQQELERREQAQAARRQQITDMLRGTRREP